MDATPLPYDLIDIQNMCAIAISKGTSNIGLASWVVATPFQGIRACITYSTKGDDGGSCYPAGAKWATQELGERCD